MKTKFYFLLISSALIIPAWIFLYFLLVKTYFNYTNFGQNSEVASFKTIELNKPLTKKIPVLMYHYVEINQDKKDFKRDSLNINPYIFEKQMITLKNAGYKFIWMSEIELALKDKSNQKYVAITFDDGYESFYSQTYPFIKKHGIKITNYIIYDSIGKLNYMSKPQLQKIYSEGLLEIGSHTLNHPDLRAFSDDEVRRQLVSSKKSLEKEFGISVVSFCYPYGFFNEKTISLVKEAGYKNSTTTQLGSVVYEDKLQTISRIRPGIKTDQELLKYIDSINY
jgi:peptidoglycan/xylan/chitin deacetylase (PgdA/CDA1 family)